MKVLYIAHFNEKSGWGNAARSYAHAMEAADIDVACRIVHLNNDRSVPEDIKHLVEKPCNFPDITIQHVLPSYMEYHGDAGINIGMYASETESLPPAWVSKINLMDRAIVFCNSSKFASQYAGVNIPIDVIPHALATSKYIRNYPEPPLPPEMKDDFIFYTVSEFVNRKNIEAIIKAFHITFHKDENVQLLLKLSIPGCSPQQSLDNINKMLYNVKSGLRIYPNIEDYKTELLITDYISDDAICSIHDRGDCFVSASRGEAFCIPAFDAAGFGNMVLVPRHTAFKDYFGSYTKARFYNASEDICFDVNTIPGLQTAHEMWHNPSIVDLSYMMRNIYNNRHKIDFVDKFCDKFSYGAIGKKLDLILKSALNK